MATMQEIADACGVSRATVSAVLNGKPGVADRTRQRILDVIRGGETVPRLVSRTLVTHFSQTIGVLVRDLDNPFHTAVLSGATDVLVSDGYHALVQSDMLIEEHVEAIQLFREFDLAGYLVSGLSRGRTRSLLEWLFTEGRPVVVYGGVQEDNAGALRAHVVDADFTKAASLATEHLIQQGHKRIAFLSGPTGFTEDRIRGYMEAMLHYRTDFQLVRRAGITAEDGHKAGLSLLVSDRDRPTGVVCYNDLVAFGIYRAAFELGMRIPDDVSVVGIDNISFANCVFPPLTTVSVNPRRIGEVAARTLLEALTKDRRSELVREIVDVELVARESVRKIDDAP